MLNFETPGGTGHIETKWSELNPVQFTDVVEITNLFFAQKFDIDEYRLRLLEVLTGYRRKNKRNKQADQINENLFLISEQLTFTLTPVIGPPEILDFFSPELRELLKTRFPWEIYEPEFAEQLLTVKEMLTVEYALNFDLQKNPIPHLQSDKGILYGPVFDTTDGDIETNLSTEQYLDASEYFNAYSSTKKEKYLNAFITCLYKTSSDLEKEGCFLPHKGEMSEGQRGSDLPNPFHKKTTDAIIMLFMYIQHTFLNDPVFGVLFSDGGYGKSGMAKLSLGASEALYQVVEQGYGTLDDVKSMNIRDFFNTQIMILKKNIAQLRAIGKKTPEIAAEMNLDIETIQKL